LFTVFCVIIENPTNSYKIIIENHLYYVFALNIKKICEYPSQSVSSMYFNAGIKVSFKFLLLTLKKICEYPSQSVSSVYFNAGTKVGFKFLLLTLKKICEYPSQSVSSVVKDLKQVQNRYKIDAKINIYFVTEYSLTCNYFLIFVKL